jgi:hypothetical protein
MRNRPADTVIAGPPLPYQAALDELGLAVRRVLALAEMLDHFAGLLRGRPTDPEGPPLEAYPSFSEIRHALDRRQKALEAAEREWERLPLELRECSPRPGELLQGE